MIDLYHSVSRGRHTLSPGSRTIIVQTTYQHTLLYRYCINKQSIKNCATVSSGGFVKESSVRQGEREGGGKGRIHLWNHQSIGIDTIEDTHRLHR